MATLEAQIEAGKSELSDSQNQVKSLQDQLNAAKKRMEVLDATLKVRSIVLKSILLLLMLSC